MKKQNKKKVVLKSFQEYEERYFPELVKRRKLEEREKNLTGAILGKETIERALQSLKS
jgi:hypothetical protein